MESCILIAKSLVVQPIQTRASPGLCLRRLGLQGGWRTSLSSPERGHSCPLQSYLGAGRSCPFYAPTSLQIPKQNNCYF